MKTLLIEGVRFIPHSYACVNMWQCLELLKRDLFTLYHRDRSICDWNVPRQSGLFSSDSEARLAAIPPLPDGDSADIVYRIDFPHRLTPTNPEKLVVFVTAEFNTFPTSHIAGGRNLAESLASGNAIIVTPSEWSRQQLLCSGAPSDRVVVVPLGVDTSIFKPASPEVRSAKRAALAWEDRFIFLHCGCMAPNKGMLMLLKSFARIARNYPDALLCLKGLDSVYTSFSFLQQYKEALTEEERRIITGRVSYLGGSLPFMEMAELYQAADTYVAPYLAEAFNLPVLEASACGLPVICTQGGPTDEFTSASFARYITSLRAYDPKHMPLLPDGEHLTELMAEVVEDTALRKNAMIEGPTSARNGWTWAHAIDRLIPVLSV